MLCGINQQGVLSWWWSCWLAACRHKLHNQGRGGTSTIAYTTSCKGKVLFNCLSKLSILIAVERTHVPRSPSLKNKILFFQHYPCRLQNRIVLFPVSLFLAKENFDLVVNMTEAYKGEAKKYTSS